MTSIPVVKSADISVCIPDKNLSKKYSILKFKTEDKVDLKTYTDLIKLERENNLREFKSANDIDLMPKSGAGSEYGREQREEARRKKFGMRSRNYNPKDQPWIFKMGTGNQSRKYRGVRSGGVSENASYFVLMRDPSKNKFVAFPVDEWYDFSLLPNNNCLTAEQAEEEFSRRGNVHNHFAIMINQKIQAAKSDGVQNENEGLPKKGKRKNKLLVSEFDQIDDNDDENDDENEEEDNIVDDGRPKKSKKGKGKSKRKRKKKKGEDGEEDFEKEADEESDELDEGQELDYISGSSSDDEGMYDDDGKRDKSETYRDGGVAEEEGLRRLVESDDDEDDDERKKNDDVNDDEDDKDDEGKLDKSKDWNEASESDSTSDSDDDPDRYALPNKDSIASSQTSKIVSKGKEIEEIKPGSLSQQTNNDKIAKRKSKTNQIVSNLNKKIKLEESTMNTQTSQTAAFIAQGGSNVVNEMEVEIKKYLERKPMTVVALAKKIWPKFQSRISTSNFESIMGEVIKKMELKKTFKNNETLLSIH